MTFRDDLKKVSHVDYWNPTGDYNCHLSTDWAYFWARNYWRVRWQKLLDLGQISFLHHWIHKDPWRVGQPMIRPASKRFMLTANESNNTARLHIRLVIGHFPPVTGTSAVMNLQTIGELVLKIVTHGREDRERTTHSTACPAIATVQFLLQKPLYCRGYLKILGICCITSGGSNR